MTSAAGRIKSTHLKGKLPVPDYLAARESQIWTREDTDFIRDHLRKVDELATKLVEAAREGKG